VPGARCSELTGVADGRLRVRLAAAAIEGRANDELVRFLATTLGVPRRDVAVSAGSRSRRKLVAVAGVTLADAKHRLGL
jgi:uncharacterized protein YggU (UPF0235/DUF167 family)